VKQETPTQRERLIAPLISGKRVLDIGSLGQSAEYCLWRFLAKYSASLTGVDLPDAEQTAREVLQIEVNGLRHKYDPRIIYGNMENLDLGETFDVAVAGDVIEHVSNQGLFLDNIRRHLKPAGQLILTTPNAKWPTVFLRPNATHVLWHDAFTLRQLLGRHGFTLETLRYYQGNKPQYPLWQRPLLIRQQIFAVAVR
jgi:2-polyprenyl-3-methyl-5-hydroxy-6-metoxy-1,4-benzoquinol methylase